MLLSGQTLCKRVRLKFLKKIPGSFFAVTQNNTKAVKVFIQQIQNANNLGRLDDAHAQKLLLYKNTEMLTYLERCSPIGKREALEELKTALERLDERLGAS